VRNKPVLIIVQAMVNVLLGFAYAKTDSLEKIAAKKFVKLIVRIMGNASMGDVNVN